MVLRKGNIFQNNYLNTIEQDPSVIGTPDAGTTFQGVFGGRRWIKDENDVITYSGSGLWTIYDISSPSFVVNADWLNNLVQWTGSANGNMMLPNSTTLDVPEGFHFSIYNNSDSYNIQIFADSGVDISSHNKMFYIPAKSHATCGIMQRNGTVDWYVSIEQSFEAGLGAVADTSLNTVAVLADTWTELIMTTPTYDGLLNTEIGTANGRIKINFADNLTNGVYVVLSAVASMEIPDQTAGLDLSFGINGVIASGAEVFHASVSSSGKDTAGMYFSFAFTFDGITSNGDEMSLFIRYTDDQTINITQSSMQITLESLQGVDLTIELP